MFIVADLVPNGKAEANFGLNGDKSPLKGVPFSHFCESSFAGVQILKTQRKDASPDMGSSVARERPPLAAGAWHLPVERIECLLEFGEGIGLGEEDVVGLGGEL